MELSVVKFKHKCADWDYMEIDESCPEFMACHCYCGSQWKKISNELPPYLQTIDLSDGKKVIVGWRESEDEEELSIYSPETREWVQDKMKWWCFRPNPPKEEK